MGDESMKKRVRGYVTRGGREVSSYDRKDRGLGENPRGSVIPRHVVRRDSYGIFRPVKMRRLKLGITR